MIPGRITELRIYATVHRVRVKMFPVDDILHYLDLFFLFLYFSSMAVYYFIPFLGCTVSLLLITGFKLALTLKRNRWVLLYNGIIVFVFLGAYLIAGAPKLPVFNIGNISSKREYKETFIGVTGRQHTKEENKSFWKAAVGEGNPSQSKKDDYGREDK